MRHILTTVKHDPTNDIHSVSDAQPMQRRHAKKEALCGDIQRTPDCASLVVVSANIDQQGSCREYVSQESELPDKVLFWQDRCRALRQREVLCHD
jgi:hypothetical protein